MDSIEFTTYIIRKRKPRLTCRIVRKSFDGEVLVVDGKVLQLLEFDLSRGPVYVRSLVLLLQVFSDLPQRLNVERDAGDMVGQDLLHIPHALGLCALVAIEASGALQTPGYKKLSFEIEIMSLAIDIPYLSMEARVALSPWSGALLKTHWR